jgi:excinuclease UvrABC ATPase subunit
MREGKSKFCKGKSITKLRKHHSLCPSVLSSCPLCNGFYYFEEMSDFYK